MPKKQKHRKWQKGKIRGQASQGNTVSFGGYGLMSLEPKWISSRQIESTRRVLSRYLQKTGKIWIRIFPDKPITAKGQEMPMGKGKGAPEYYVAVVKPGTILFEIDGVSLEIAKQAIESASHKLPVKTKFIVKK